MDRLLSRKELGTVPVRLGQYIRGVSREYDYLDRVTKAQDAKSIKVDRQAMAEWWMGEHAGDEYHEEGVRRNCPVCSDEYWLWVEGREGKAPWEAM